MPYKNKADQRASERRWIAKNPELAKQRNREYSRKYYAQEKNGTRRRVGNKARTYFFRKYGITPAVKELIWESQGKICKICGRPTEKPQTDHVDNPFKIRGILCITCNTTLGKFNDDPAVFRKMADYLETAKVNVEDFL